MKRTDFEEIYKQYPFNIWLKEASKLHANENQMYGDFPYSVHLLKTFEKIYKYGHEICKTDYDVITLFVSGMFHDVLEDLRITYYDLQKILINLTINDVCVHQIVEIIWALTTPKGKSRKERLSREYYNKVSSTKFASFIKMADRLANMEMSKYFNPTKLHMYVNEDVLVRINLDEIPQDMLTEYTDYLN